MGISNHDRSDKAVPVTVFHQKRRPAVLPCAAWALAALVVAPSARAELSFCNETDDVQSVSIGYKSGEDWISEGWWVLDPGECKDAIRENLKQRYYYYRVEQSGGDFRGGNFMFCTTPDEYTIVGDTDCAARGYDREDFAQIDTGPSATSFTVTLTRKDMAELQRRQGLTFCNETAYIQSVSVGYEGEEAFTSEGWWNVEPGKCMLTLRGPLKKRYYYYRAEVDGGDFDGENYFFCTTPKVYTIVGDTDCRARGYDRESFREIDTGSTARSFTLTLVP